MKLDILILWAINMNEFENEIIRSISLEIVELWKFFNFLKNPSWVQIQKLYIYKIWNSQTNSINNQWVKSWQLKIIERTSICNKQRWSNIFRLKVILKKNYYSFKKLCMRHSTPNWPLCNPIPFDLADNFLTHRKRLTIF